MSSSHKMLKNLKDTRKPNKPSPSSPYSAEAIQSRQQQRKLQKELLSLEGEHEELQKQFEKIHQTIATLSSNNELMKSNYLQLYDYALTLSSQSGLGMPPKPPEITAEATEISPLEELFVASKSKSGKNIDELTQLIALRKSENETLRGLIEAENATAIQQIDSYRKLIQHNSTLLAHLENLNPQITRLAEKEIGLLNRLGEESTERFHLKRRR